jgi:hypothetical protein
MGMFWQSKASQDDLDSLDDRAHVINAVRSTPGVTGDQVFADWGDHDTDHSQADHDRANGKAVKRGDDGIGLPSEKEVRKFYDDSRPYPNLRIVKPGDKE